MFSTSMISRSRRASISSTIAGTVESPDCLAAASLRWPMTTRYCLCPSMSVSPVGVTNKGCLMPWLRMLDASSSTSPTCLRGLFGLACRSSTCRFSIVMSMIHPLVF